MDGFHTREAEVKVKSLQKALKILECFSTNTPELGITQISEILSLNKSNTHNIITTFEQLGYIEKNERTGKYRLGLKMLEFAFVINENLGYQRAVHKILARVAKEVNSTIYFGIPKEDKVIYILASYPDTEEYDYPIRSIMGEKAPLYCTGIGKAMLAFMPDEALEQVMRCPRHKVLDNTIVDEDELRRELLLTRKRGYSIDNTEHELGVKCVGVPVFNSKSELVAGLSVSGSAGSFTQQQIEKYAKILMEASFQIRERL